MTKQLTKKVPKEDGELKRILDIRENTSLDHTFISVDTTGELLCGMDNLDEWFDAFQEHYNAATNQNGDYILEKGIMLKEMFICNASPRVRFRVDISKYELQFVFLKEEKQLRDVVYSFIERIIS
jgi:hypothetical protein